jgi:hypothetical protein
MSFQFVHRFVLFFLSFLLCPILVSAQTNSVPSRIIQAVEETNLTLLKGNTHPLARPNFDRGPAPPSLRMERMLLVLKRSPDQETALKTLLDQQQDKSSPNYHQWLTPEQFGQQFGPSDQDIQTITAWLGSHGLQVARVAKGRTVIEFSGTASQVQEAFRTSIHKYTVNGEDHWANSSDPSIPAALAPVVAGVVTLHNFLKKSAHHVLGTLTKTGTTGQASQSNPSLTFSAGCSSNGGLCYAIGPYDFAAIYNVLPLWKESPAINGTGQSIAIVARSDVRAQDVLAFRNFFGLPPSFQYLTLNDGPDPGIVPGDETEALVDIDWSEAVANGATIDLVVSGSTNTADGTDLSALYIVDDNVAPVMGVSFTSCESSLGSTGNQFYESLWEQASAQGITVVVSSGDSGAACESPGTEVLAPAQHGFGVNGISSTPFNVAVGGTDFDDFANPQSYFNATSDPNTLASAKGYIPETTWNDTCTNSLVQIITGVWDAETNCNDPLLPSFVRIVGAGGGASAVYSKPSWQDGSGVGVPSDGKRDVPDVSLFAGDGFIQNAYVICELDLTKGCVLGEYGPQDFLEVGGTSVSAQAFAGIMALVNQRTGQRQGNPNYVLYKLAATQAAANPTLSCNSSSPPAFGCTFYDVTKGTIAMPCQTGSPNCNTNVPSDSYGVLSGYSATSGYDLATGLGTINVANLVNNWRSVSFLPTATTLTLNNGAPVSITHGQAVPVSLAVAPQSGSSAPTGDVSLIALVGQSIHSYTGQESVGSFALSVSGSSSSVSSTTSQLPGGTNYQVIAHYAGDGSFASSDSSPVTVTVSPENSLTTANTITQDQNGNPLPFTSGPYGGSFVFLRADVSDNPKTGKFAATGLVDISYAHDGGAPTPVPGSPFTLSAESAVLTMGTLFPAGAYTVGASYEGDPSFNASVAIPFTFTVTQAPTTMPDLGSSETESGGTLIISPSTVAIGQPIRLGVTVATHSGGVAPTGTVTFLDGGRPLSGTMTMNSSEGSSYGPAFLGASLTTSLSTAGQHTITAQYSGDSNYLLSKSSAITMNAVSYGTTTAITSSAPTIQDGQTVTFVAQVTPSQSGGPTLTGTVQFQANGINVGNPVALSNGQALITTSSLPAGSVTIYANYGGDTNYATSLGVYTEAVNSVYTTITVTSSSPTISLGASVTFAAQIGPAQVGVASPSGWVLFSANGLYISDRVLVTNSQAQVTTTWLPPGTDQIRADYSGDTNYPSSFGTFTETVNAPPPLSITVNPATITIPSPGGSGSTVLTFTAHNGFTGTINLTPSVCSGLPSESSCSFSASSVVLSATTTTGSSTLTVATTAPSAAIPRRLKPPNGIGWQTLGAGIAIALLCLMRLRARRQRWSAVFAALLLAVVLTSNGCGGGSGNGSGGGISGTAPGTYTFTVIAASQGVTANATVTVTIQ